MSRDLTPFLFVILTRTVGGDVSNRYTTAARLKLMMPVAGLPNFSGL